MTGAVATPRRFVLLDRDGTINEEVGYLDHPDDLTLIHGSAVAIRGLREQGLGIVVVTNQAQIGRGLLTEERLTAIHDHLMALLAAEGASVDAILHCPHAPEHGCECRKPGTGMALEAAARFGFDPSRSFVVGDHAGDVGMGRAVGATHLPRAHGSRGRGTRPGRGLGRSRGARPRGRRSYHRLARRPGGRVTEDHRKTAGAYLRATAETMRSVEAECLDDIAAAAEILIASLRSGGKLLICGNGGSAADAQHLATEFVSTLTVDNPRPSIPAIALTTDTSLLTAIANDFGIEGVFARQVESLARAGDVLIAISTSGNSANIVRAAEQAGTSDVPVVALTGASGGRSRRSPTWRSVCRRP